MKIVFGKQEKPPHSKKFENGHLYRHAKQLNHGVLYLYTCGGLVVLPECKSIHNVTGGNYKPKEFIDVTDRFELREIE